MRCRRCGSENISVQMVSENKLKSKHHSILYWLIIGWWLHPILWLFFTIPMIFGKLFGFKKQKLVTKHKSMAVCQECGYHWNS